jgi:hypothetical protein
MKKKYKYTFFMDKRNVASCVVNTPQKAAFERLMGLMARICSHHNYNVQFECTEIVTD